MSGGAYEYVSAYVNNGNEKLTINGQNILVENNLKYKNVYTKGLGNNQSDNYNTNKNIYGDAVWKTSNNMNSAYSWYSNYLIMLHASVPFFIRGGGVQSTKTGLFYFSHSGPADSYVSCHPVFVLRP